jgi:hypothetical protein
MKRQRRVRFEAAAISRCAWCGQAPDTQQVFGFGARASPGIDLGPHRGQIIEIAIGGAGRTAPALVVGPNSPAAREGHDLYFMTCTQDCLRALKSALEAEIGRDRDPGRARDAGP